MIIYFLKPINQGFDQARNSVMYSINNYNPVHHTIQLAGYSSYADNENVRRYNAILWESTDWVGLPPDENMIFLSSYIAGIDLNYNPDVDCIAYGLNNVYPSHTVGSTKKAQGLPYIPVKWEEKGLTYLNTLGGAEGEARGVNDDGNVTGWCKNANGLNRAFLWIKGSNLGAPENPDMIDIGTLGGAESIAFAINNLGQIVGWSNDVNGNQHAFLWTPGGTDGVVTNPQMKDIHSSGYRSSVAFDINDLGHIVGYMNNGTDQGFCWRPETGAIELENLGHSGRALSININGVIVGYSLSISTGKKQAVCWTNFVIANLNPLVVSDQDWLLTEASGINSRGDIVCNAHQAGSNKGIAALLNAIIVFPPGKTIKLSAFLYFNWLAYRFWWHFPAEFSQEETKKIKGLLKKKNVSGKSKTDHSMPVFFALTRFMESLSLMENQMGKRKIQKLLFELMIDEIKSKL